MSDLGKRRRESLKVVKVLLGDHSLRCYDPLDLEDVLILQKPVETADADVAWGPWFAQLDAALAKLGYRIERDANGIMVTVGDA